MAALTKTRYPGIFKRGGRYMLIYRDAQGRQRSMAAKTLAEARAKRSDRLSEVASGEYREPSKVTFADYAAEWVTSYQGRTSRGLREATREDYARGLGLDPSGKALDPARGAVAFFAGRRLTEIEPRDLKRYAAEVASRGVSRDTIRLAVAPVRAMLATAVEDGIIRSNPAAGLRLTQPVASVPEHDEAEKAKALTEEELASLIAEAAPGYGLLIEFLAVTGLRPSEAFALRWADIDFGRRRVKVRRSVNRGRVGPPKTKYGRRDVPLAAGTAQALWQVRKERKPGEAEPVFVSARGEAVGRGPAYRAVKAAAKRAGVPWAGLRTLRHTCASILFRRGFNPKQVQAYLGHHSAAFTLATYVHLLPDDLPEPTFFDAITGRSGSEVAASPAENGRDAAQVANVGKG